MSALFILHFCQITCFLYCLVCRSAMVSNSASCYCY